MSRLEDIRIFIYYVPFKDYKIYQMDVKSDFLNVLLQEKVYVEHPEFVN